MEMAFLAIACAFPFAALVYIALVSSNINDYVGRIDFTVNSSGQKYVAIYNKKQYTREEAWEKLKPWKKGDFLPNIIVIPKEM